jgi:hypothetical protein
MLKILAGYRNIRLIMIHRNTCGELHVRSNNLNSHLIPSSSFDIVHEEIFNSEIINLINGEKNMDFGPRNINIALHIFSSIQNHLETPDVLLVISTFSRFVVRLCLQYDWLTLILLLSG